MPQYSSTGLLTSDTTVKAVAGHVKSISIGWRGCAAGEFCTLIDDTSDLIVFVFATANGFLEKTWPEEGKKFDTNIKFNKGGTAGDVYAEMMFK